MRKVTKSPEYSLRYSWKHSLQVKQKVTTPPRCGGTLTEAATRFLWSWWVKTSRLTAKKQTQMAATNEVSVFTGIHI